LTLGGTIVCSFSWLSAAELGDPGNVVATSNRDFSETTLDVSVKRRAVSGPDAERWCNGLARKKGK